MSDSWIVPLVNDPRSLLIWLRFFDKSSFLDRIDDDTIERSSVIEFAFTWAFVPSYPIFRMVQKKTSAFRSAPLFACAGDKGTLTHSEVAIALDEAARDRESCRGVAQEIHKNHNLLCRKETPTRHVFPKESHGVISIKNCLTKTTGNSAECYSPVHELLSDISNTVHPESNPQKNSADRPTVAANGLFRPKETSVSLTTCLQRMSGPLVQCMDSNGDGHVDRTEFEQNLFAISVLNASLGTPQSSFCQQLKDKLDEDGDGHVSASEIAHAVAVLAPGKTADEHKAIGEVAARLIEEGSTSVSDRFQKNQLDLNVQCISFLKDSIERQSRDFQSDVALVFLFLRFLCEGWSFITLILWFSGTYQTPRFGSIWFMSIAKHMMGTTFAAVVMYYCLWHVMPSFVMSSISYVFIYFIWPIGSLVLAYSFIMDGLKPATFAAIKAASPRPPPNMCRSPAFPIPSNSLDAGSRAISQPLQPTRRGVGARAMSPASLQ